MRVRIEDPKQASEKVGELRPNRCFHGLDKRACGTCREFAQYDGTIVLPVAGVAYQSWPHARVKPSKISHGGLGMQAAQPKPPPSQFQVLGLTRGKPKVKRKPVPRSGRFYTDGT